MMPYKFGFLTLLTSLALLTGSFMFFLNTISSAQAFFFDQTLITNNTINISDWTPPESTDDISHLLPAFINSRTFDVYITANDAHSKIVEVRLYYSYGNLDQYRFVLYQTYKSSQNDFIADSNINLKFTFNSPLGDGHYDLAIVAIDEFGNTEALPTPNLPTGNLISIDVDTTPPVTALSLPESSSSRFLSADQEIHGSFEANDTTGFFWGGNNPNDQKIITDPALAHRGSAAFQLGDPLNSQVTTNYLTKNYLLTTPSWLSFFWRFISKDYIDFDYFTVTASASNQSPVQILWYGLDVNDPPYDTGWVETSYFFDHPWVGQILNLRFELKNTLDDNYPSYVLIDDIRFIPENNQFVAASANLDILSKDASGAGVSTINICLNNNCTAYSPDPTSDTITITPLPLGDVTIQYWSQDDLGNTEATKTARLKIQDDTSGSLLNTTDPRFHKNIVLNQFLPNPDPSFNQGNDTDSMPLGEWVELFNRHPNQAIDVNNWYLKDQIGNTIVLTPARNPHNTTVINPLSSLIFYLNKAFLNNTNDQLLLYDNNNLLIDSITYDKTQPGKTYKRDPNGFGSWMDPIPSITLPASSSAKLNSPTSSPASPSAILNLSFTSTASAIPLTPTPTPTALPTLPTLTPSPSPILTPTLTPSLTPSPTPTLSVFPSPTSTPTPSLPTTTSLSTPSASPNL